MDMNSIVESTLDSSSSNAASKDQASEVEKPSNTEDVTLEQEVKQLVGSVSSWWTGFSKRVSSRNDL